MRASEALSKARPKSPDAGIASPPLERFRLCGPTRPLDPRTHALRRDIADVALAGLVFAPHYASGLAFTCLAASATMYGEPSISARAVSQLLHGEGFLAFDLSGGWAWGRSVHDDYVGYVPAAALGARAAAPTHRVAVSQAPLFAAADIKSPVQATWTIGVPFAGTHEGDFIATGAGFVHRRHAVAADTIEEPAAVAERLLGLPYLWGGRGAGGIDCSGLVQQALAAGGIAAPRDSDLQRTLGREVPAGEPLRRGDLLFFPGHVGIMADATRLVHATAHWMGTVAEPLADVVARLQAAGDAQPVLARRRIE